MVCAIGSHGCSGLCVSTHCNLVRQNQSMKWVIIGSGNGLGPVTQTNDDLLSTETLKTNFENFE